MAFNIGLSGLNASSKDLEVIGNNISNVGTTGFKKSRAEFADIYAVSPFGNSKTAVGSGVLLTNVAQQFLQGNLEFTDSSLDLSINGGGFFAVSPDLSGDQRQYTRAGAFGLDDEGFVVNASGQYLLTFPVNDDGSVTSTSLSTTSPLQLPASAGTPRATTEIELGVNLPADATDLNVNNFDPTDSNTFTNSTSVTAFDSLGDSHIVTTYYVKDAAAANQWAVYTYVDGNPVDVPGGVAGAGGQLYSRLNFDAAGNLTSTTPAPIQTAAIPLTNGANDLQITIDLANNTPTQFAANFQVTALSQDGFTTGRLSGLSVSEDGLIVANYTNGQSDALGKVALANFTNPQGLKQIGNTAWQETLDSGEALAGEAGNGQFGLIRSGALEQSNVNLTQELVGLITAQRNFQANAKTIETSSTITQTIININ